MNARRASGALLAVVVALAGGLATAEPAHATWSDQNCNGQAQAMSHWKRSQAKAYAVPMIHEGYEWGGGCYKLNDHDDTPGAPDSSGEGNDCSGFAFRVWALTPNGGADRYRYYDYDKFIHGPYYTSDYYSPAPGDPFHSIAKGYLSTNEMDGFVYRIGDSGHIGLIYEELSGGSDTIIEAKGDADGTGMWTRQYRDDSAYKGVMREGWTPDCYPRCTKPA